ncbi:hypothetical protein [Streptomyces yangpuensis]|uniref:hypothetical protein n=1 Tax=Streptomyces yangpuensis TaxID=1648182 RepID=UPI00364B7536
MLSPPAIGCPVTAAAGPANGGSQAQATLTEAIEQVGIGEFDANEYGGGEVVLYACGPDADALFPVRAPTVRGLPFRPAQMTRRLPNTEWTSDE